MVVGRLAGAYGVQGWIKATPFSSAQESVLSRVATWWLSGSPPQPLPVRGARAHGATVVAASAAVGSREQAAALRGRDILVSRADFPDGGDDFYWIDLIGCAVENPRGVALGRVGGLADHGGHSLLEVAGPDGVARLIPFVAQYIVEVDPAARRIVADWDLDY